MSKIAKALSLIERGKAKEREEDKAAKAHLLEESYEAEADPVVVSDARDLILISEPYERSFEELEARRIIHVGMNDFEVERAFRDLRSTVIQKCNGQSGVILVTSAIHGGGASFVSINLAAAFALDKARTAIVLDCNLQNPGFYDALAGDGDALGLTDYLDVPGTPVEKIVHKTGIPRLRLIPAGQERESRSEYFTLDLTKKLLHQLKRRYKDRYVFIDSPALSKSADTRALTELCDFVILVVPYGKVTAEDINRSCKEIPDDKLMGIVFNNEPRFRFYSSAKS